MRNKKKKIVDIVFTSREVPLQKHFENNKEVFLQGPAQNLIKQEKMQQQIEGNYLIPSIIEDRIFFFY